MTGSIYEFLKIKINASVDFHVNQDEQLSSDYLTSKIFAQNIWNI